METKPKRARVAKGQFRADDPTTSSVNEAYEQPAIVLPPAGSAARKALVLRGIIPA